MRRTDLGTLALLFGLAGAGCGATPVAEHSPSKSTNRKPVCLVLSVGADRGLAHIGVIHALYEHGVKADCVVGTSMGSLIGGLYAYAPSEDPAVGYRQVFKNYTRIKEDEAGGSGLVGFLIGGALAAATGGTGVALALGSASGTVLGASSVQIKDWNTLHQSLAEHFKGTRIESLKVPFITQYRVPEAPDSQTVTGGKLADEIATSVKNPLLFPHLRVDAQSELDPGLDQLSAVPLNVACERFPNHQLVVSNVTGSPGKILRGTSCSMQEVMIDVPPYNRERAIQGKDPEFSHLIQAGFSAAVTGLEWEKLPRAAAVPSSPIRPVKVFVKVFANATKSDGRPWDADGSAPDVELGLVVGDVADAYGTSVGSFYGAKGATNKGVIDTDLGLMRLRRGQILGIHLIDSDVMQDDPMGRGTAVFDGPGVAKVRTEGATVEVEFRTIETN